MGCTHPTAPVPAFRVASQAWRRLPDRAFGPDRNSVAGDHDDDQMCFAGRTRYKKHITIADDRFRRHLKRLEQ
jgi:hypothetical protein